MLTKIKNMIKYRWAGFITSVHHGRCIPAFNIIREIDGENLRKELSIFVDESGDFGKYNSSCPFYIVSFVFHEQNKDISKEVQILDNFLLENSLKNHTIHTAPLIRREKSYINTDIKLRNKIFQKLFNFTRNIDIAYETIIVDKQQCSNQLDITRAIATQLFFFMQQNYRYFTEFDNIIIYYDNGQFQLTNILTAVFGVLFGDCIDYKTVFPGNYKLFQTADLICTLSLIKTKITQGKTLTASEKLFFGSASKLRKNYLKFLEKIRFQNKLLKIKY